MTENSWVVRRVREYSSSPALKSTKVTYCFLLPYQNLGRRTIPMLFVDDVEVKPSPAINDQLAYGFAAATILDLSEEDRCWACYEVAFTSGRVQGKNMIVPVCFTTYR
ncbi:unnamed protein product [Darwinula stevensoni]|uniref:cellulase n=1 Tax=Darwinula stevensoni TaxID=69355 RepID=A0A7R8X7F7_9CRUS|nr:unnamed protein product [Darwinula stevensoni]CAG0882262.1 unnamed protein product [Darwinula stevensoni]